MSKTIVMVSIDSDILEQFKRQEGRGNVSKAVNNFMSQSIRRSNETIAPQDAAILEIEYNKTKEELNSISAKMKEIEDERQRIKDANIEQQKADLEAEKERMENALKCKKCSNFVEEKTKVKLKDGQLCKACFFSLTSDEAKKLGI